MTSRPHIAADICPCLTYDDAPAAIRWLCAVFGFTQRLVVPGPDNTVKHAELSLGNGVIMLGSPKPEMDLYSPRHEKGAPSTLSVYVSDPDAHHARAVAAGAKIMRALHDEEYGARGYGVEDLEGHQWYFGNYRPGGYWEHPPAHTNI